MRWLKSATEKSWVANGVLIQGNSGQYTVVEEKKYSKICDNKVFASLIKHGHIIVLNEEPAELRNSLSNLQETNVTMRREIESLKRQLEEVSSHDNIESAEASKREIEDIRSQAISQITQKDKEIEELKEQLAKVNSKKSQKKEE